MVEISAPAASLRPMVDEDLSAIVEIEKRIHVSPWNDSQFQGELAKPYARCWVLTDDETDSVIQGYLIFWILGDDCQLLNLGVDLPYRGLKLGHRLMESLIREAIQCACPKIMLDVRKSNLAAIHLYQSHRFNVTQVRKGFYSNGEDAYTMTLELQGDAVDF